MRWTKGFIGSRRRCAGFLFLPRECSGEFRWLEWANWEEVCDYTGRNWRGLRWLDGDKP